MTTQHFLSNQFLVAMPSLKDSKFSHTVSYICQHNEEGALGIVINRPTSLTLSSIFEQMKISTNDQYINDTPVYSGGPVHSERGFIIHSKYSEKLDSSIEISETVCLTSSRDVLEDIADGNGPEKYLISLGYAGWGAGQLEQEIIDNAWLNAPCDEQILYQTPVDQRWMMAANQIGIDINKLTGQAGHA